ncbi:transmembrane protein 40 isoform X2 [Engystomops pustulosus]|uniref:transmembrane protein 40 isoform X2 n=1 Tax=Engystomops pustulosus TaxID=76066 RepID=UPI003AFAE8D2
MNSEKISLPTHSQEEQDIFQKAFIKDFEDLKTNPAISPSFCDHYVTICKMSSLSLYTAKEAQTIVQPRDPSEMRLALLKSVDDKGPQAVAIFYLLLHMSDEKAYGKLPSCKDNDEKKILISKMRDKSLDVLHNKASEMMSTCKILLSTDTNNQEESNINEDTSAPQKGKHQIQRRPWGIQKDDEFFHFVIVCFSLGAILICEYYYSDWTVSAGIGLIAFASLETIGIYFGMVYRIKTTLEQLSPLLGNILSNFFGFKKKQ